MRKATVSSSARNIIAVSVVSFGNDPIALPLPTGATVSQALAQAGIARTGQEVFVSGEVAEDNDVLEAGDVISLVTPKQAGA